MQPISSSFIEKLCFNEKGLIPAIAQDWLDGTVLMMAWMSRESIKKTIETNEVHYWSRSRNELWHKGETSGHIQMLKDLRYDCDADVLLLSIEQKDSIACHTGSRSCFFEKPNKTSNQDTDKTQPSSDACSDLYKVIEGRYQNPLKGSYTNKLLEGGDNQILKKIGEESTEFVMACKDNNSIDIASEAADLIFHMQVALAFHGVKWREVLEILASRRGAARRD